ncbi:MAG: glycogen debranching protein GlgX [Candidatus Hydrogenedentes bacterium]|nr:glycogen debranching protein GlgX [Candidatus Hydrogenedentota bacterium]
MPKLNTDRISVTSGRPYPLGISVMDGGVRFSLFSRHATRVWVALFEEVTDREPVWEFEFNPVAHRTGDVWSIFVRRVPEGTCYMFRLDGPRDRKRGHLFNPRVYLLDPYARAFSGDVSLGTLKSVAVRDSTEWAGDPRPRIPMKDTIIYETHVRGFTKDPSSGAQHPGTYRGLIEKIPYLKDLGVTAVELLPINEFGETRMGRCSLDSGEELTNYWGYNSIGFFAPTSRYACSAESRGHVDEFREMVRALHDAGMEVILDVVFNHTSEGNHRGPTLCFRGIDNAIYYMLDGNGNYLNFSGCGNTVNCNHPLVRDFILDCLRYWVAIRHVDGFRFDLASILGRDQKGNVVPNSPLVERIAEDPVLRDTKLIAEAWDAGGAYQVGSFGDSRWAEWNGRYRDDVRSFWLGTGGMRGAFASRLMGSADIYEWAARSPEHSINFVTCHDGFTLRDLVTYTQKRNLANGEANRDGSDDNRGMNCGVEGETEDRAVNAIRLRMQKNHLATLFLSLGVPMLLGGDEFGRTQQGNNNAYCQDNEISWYNWKLLDRHHDLHSFCKRLIAFRKANPALCRAQYFKDMPPDSALEPEVVWFDESGAAPAWNGENGNTLGCKIAGRLNNGVTLCLLFNSAPEAMHFALPEGEWRIRLDTAAISPMDLPEPERARNAHRRITLPARSVMALSKTD